MFKRTKSKTCCIVQSSKHSHNAKFTLISPNNGLLFHMIVIMILVVVSRIECGVLPVHTPLDKLLTGTVLSCLPDQVEITSASSSATDYPTGLQGKCVKCTEFDLNTETCSIVSIRHQIINTKLITPFAGSIFGSCQNSYIVSTTQICYHKVMSVQLPDANYGNCFAAIPNCYKCFAGGHCYNCQYGFYGQDPQQYLSITLTPPSSSLIWTGFLKCTQLEVSPKFNYNCLMAKINNQQKCKVCLDGFYLKGNDQCSACGVISGCSECSDANTCTKCQIGYSLQSNGSCVVLTKCVSGSFCNLCSSVTISGTQLSLCEVCQPNSFLLRQLTDCSPDCSKLHTNCEICYWSLVVEAYLCRKCSPGYYVNSKGECQSCSKHMPGCIDCTLSKICTQCSILYTLDNKACKPCSDAGNQCIKCEMATSPTQLICKQCRKGHFLNHNHPTTAPSDVSQQCTQCLSNCGQCTNATGCDQCAKDYFWDTTSTKCRTCNGFVPNCRICKVNTATHLPQCRVCQINYALQPNTNNPQQMICGPCSYIHQSCTKCDKITMCTECGKISGDYLDIVSWNCIPCLDPCKTCTKKYKCLTCQGNFLVQNFTKGECLPCDQVISNCEWCTSYLQTGTDSSYVNECKKCLPYHILVANPISNPLLPKVCQPCDSFSYTERSNPLSTCILCSNQCSTCAGPNQCRTCLNVYAQKWINSKLQCYDKCGDKKIATLDCDLDIGNMYDGCTSQCQVEPGFVCELYFSKNHTIVPDKNDKTALKSYLHSLTDRNSSEHFYSRCSYDGKVQMSVRHIIKERFSNQLTIEVKLDPFLHSYKLLSPAELHSIFTLTHNSSIVQPSLYTTELLPKNQSVLFTLQLQHHLTQPLTIDLTHSKITSEPRSFILTQDSSITFVPDDQTGVKAFFYSSDDLALWKSVHTVMQVLSAVGVVGALASVVVKNLAGVEFLWILQAMFVSLFWYQEPLTLPLFSLSGLSLSTGINPSAAFSKPYAPQAISSRLLYESPSQQNSSSQFVELQLTVFIFPLLYLLSQLAWVLEDVRNATVVIWARYFNVFFANDGMMLTALFMLQSLLNQTFALYFAWNVLEPFSQYLATMLIVFGWICMLMVLIGWFRAQQPKYQKTNQKTRPYGLLLSSFSRYNMPLIKQKFFSLYIVIMFLSTFASVFGYFYPLMPVLLYVFLAFVIVVYRPYNRMISNYRALFFALVIAFGYFIRVAYIFSFAEDTSTTDGYTLANLWVIYFWMVLVIGAFVFFVVDVVKDFRQGREMAEKLQKEFKEKLEGENKILQKKMAEEARKYDSHKNQLQNFAYNNFYHHEIGPKIDIKGCKNEEEVEKKFEEAKKKLKPKPVEKDEVFYISNKNKKRPQKKSNEDDKDEGMGQNREGKKRLNHWLEAAKSNLEQERLQKVKKEQQKQLSIAFEITLKILDEKEALIDEKLRLMDLFKVGEFDQMSQLVKQDKMERIRRVYEQYVDLNIRNKGEGQKIDIEGMINKIKQENIEEFKAVNACEKGSKGLKGQNKFPVVEIHYKKAYKITEQQKEKKNLKKRPNLNIEIEKVSQVGDKKVMQFGDEKMKLNEIRRQLKGMVINPDNQNKFFRHKNK